MTRRQWLELALAGGLLGGIALACEAGNYVRSHPGPFGCGSWSPTMAGTGCGMGGVPLRQSRLFVSLLASRGRELDDEAAPVNEHPPG